MNIFKNGRIIAAKLSTTLKLPPLDLAGPPALILLFLLSGHVVDRVGLHDGE